MTPSDVAAALAAAGPVRERVLTQLVESLVLEDAVDMAGDGGPGTRAGPFAVEFVRTPSCGRVRLTSPVTRDGAAVTPGEFLADAPVRADPACRARLGQELTATVLGDALALRARPDGPLDPDAGHDVLEALVADGHRYHPAYKSRTGFGVGDLLAYTPEFAPTVHPVLLDADPSLVSVSASAGLDPAAVWSAPAGRVGIPVHPWQWDHHVAAAHAASLASGTLRVGGPDEGVWRPQASIRTLARIDVPRAPSVKMPLAITNTSTSRGLAPHTVRNAAPISDWLAGIVAGDPVLAEKARVIVLREILGVSVEPGLGAIWRESLHVHLHPGERAVPFPGLASRSAAGVPLIDPWIREQGPRAWTERLVTATVLPLVHLLVVHGVALESHAQNMLLVHAGGLPTRVALKDFHDGVRFSRSLLAAPGPVLEAPPADHPNANSFLETDDPTQVTGFLLDCLCFVNLAEIAYLLAGEYGFAEEEFWAVAARAIRDHAARVPGFADRLAVFDVFAPTLSVEKLTTRRLWPDTELRVHDVPNPLCE
ncbi:siderophore biosynthesis protein IucA [Actinomycetospora sp. NBRC 106375]|uniref:IucA/IucC family protein n=1 Tax=Actinomycetospora sp. NBRC 106375 TaxID=3032207 RepID=UPI0024A31934|nr:IucA/IucC family protein [Actinomycetospora sp. NBRC 106375]GLZ49409.1 siderophore biosynthesis protein IucA [Actinomycetospora sp. NBRC 106375]